MRAPSVLLVEPEAATPLETAFRDAGVTVFRLLDAEAGWRAFVQTPPDLERELGLRRGNVMHVEMGLDAMFGWRPLPEWSAYRGPYQGLYLTGASTHPGGGVFGASGRSAARVLLTDCANRPRWRPRSRRRGPWRR